jgi:hypothetical protein
MRRVFGLLGVCGLAVGLGCGSVREESADAGRGSGILKGHDAGEPLADSGAQADGGAAEGGERLSCEAGDACLRGGCGDASYDYDAHGNGVCVGGASGVVNIYAVTEQSSPSIAIDEANIYWSAGASVLSAPKCGGAPFTVATSSLGTPTTLAVDGANVYWTDIARLEDGDVGELVMSVHKGGGTVLTLTAQSAFVSGNTIVLPTGLVVDDTDVYVTACASNSPSPNTVLRVPKGGGATVTLASTLRCPVAIAIDAANVYWADDNAPVLPDGAIMRVPKAGGLPVTLAALPESPAGMVAVDGENVYWVEDSGLWRVPKCGGSAVALAPLIDGLGNVFFPPPALAIDKDGVYLWTDGITKVPKDGGAATTLARGPFQPSGGLVLDGTSVYWVSSSGVQKVAK